jgi:hypothetical protein
VPGVGAPRVSGSTSQILAAAMRVGPGSASSLARRGLGPAGGDTGKLGVTPSGAGTAATVELATGDTERTSPGGKRRDLPARPNPTAVIFALAAALLLALIGIAALLLQR